MNHPAFAIGEWLVCPRCSVICDEPFRPLGCDASQPELGLGASLPESEDELPEIWRVEVAANCPECGIRLVASAVFEGRILRDFAPVNHA
jgi:hypothetical protein